MGLPTFAVPGVGTVPAANAGRHDAVDSAGVVLSNEDLAKLDAILTKLTNLETIGNSTAVSLVASADEYETVAANATDQALGTTGATGDRLTGIIIQPQTTAPGNVIVKDGSTVIYTWPGSSSFPAGLPAVPVPFGIRSVSGGFKVTTGANVTVIAPGDFT